MHLPWRSVALVGTQVAECIAEVLRASSSRKTQDGRETCALFFPSFCRSNAINRIVEGTGERTNERTNEDRRPKDEGAENRAKSASGGSREPVRGSQNRSQIDPKPLRGALGTTLGVSKRIRDALGTRWGRSGMSSGRRGTLPGRSWDAPGRSWNAPGYGRDAPGMLWGAPRTPPGSYWDNFFVGIARGTGFAWIFTRSFDGKTVACLIDRAWIRDRNFNRFSIVFRTLFRPTLTSRVERSIIADPRFLSPLSRFYEVFSISHVFERTQKRWTRRSKIDRQVDQNNIDKSMQNRS